MTTKMNCVCDHINSCLKKVFIFGVSWWISFDYIKLFKPPTTAYLSINRYTLNPSQDFFCTSLQSAA